MADRAVDDLYAQCPRLGGPNHARTSPPSGKYNCVAWVKRDQDAWIEPGINWPDDLPEPLGEEDLDAFIALFERWGFRQCADPSLEEGYLKIAIYESGGRFHHVAKQLPSGRWSSKLGRSFDVRHDELEELYDAPLLGRATATVYMKRDFDGSDPFYVEDPRIITP